MGIYKPCVNSWANGDLYPWLGNKFRRKILILKHLYSVKELFLCHKLFMGKKLS